VPVPLLLTEATRETNMLLSGNLHRSLCGAALTDAAHDVV
jgi:hypothetical protein